MNKLVTTSILLILLSACVSKTKNETAKGESKELKEKLKGVQAQLAQYKAEIEQLKENNSELQKQLEEVKKEFKKPEHQSKGELLYSVIKENDGFWRRGVIYELPDKNEKLFNPKCIEIQDTLRFFFFGANRTGEVQGDYDSVLVKLYEYIPKMHGRVKEIDRFKCCYEWEYDYFFLSMEDNLVFNGDKMYYHKHFENKKITYSVEDNRDNFEYYEYNMLSHQKKGAFKFKDISLYFDKYSNCAISENSNMIAQHRDILGDIVFFTYSSLLDKREAYLLIKKGTRGYETDKVYNEDGIQQEFSLLDIKSEREAENDPEMYALGYLSWDYKGDNLFFCNSNIVLACIWKLDIQEADIKRIVPEHNAIHPFYFEYYDKSMVLYVEDNKLMVCESPN